LPVYHRPAIAQQRQKNIKHRTTANKNTTKPLRISHAPHRPGMFEEAHGICVTAGSTFKSTTAPRQACDYAALIAPTALAFVDKGNAKHHQATGHIPCAYSMRIFKHIGLQPREICALG
jgi:ketopantoate hydroxymethyltransferase